MAELAAGETLVVLATDPEAPLDLAAWARIAAAGQLPGLGVARHRLHAAEVEVALLPAGDGPARSLERLERARVDARLGLDDASLQVQARQVDRLLGLEAEVDDVQ